MNVFYAPGIKGNTYILDKKESKHCVKVLRLKKSSPVLLIDGTGNLYEGEVAEPNPAGCLIRITNVKINYQPKLYRLHLAVSLLKNPERFDWLVEKSVEIGVDEITPLICTNTEKKNVRVERINNIIIVDVLLKIAWL
ncbi:MAG: RsmE family RNA methyltransferase, partial [Bacteroidales bacterium]